VNAEHVLIPALAVAVPLWIHELQQLTGDTRDQQLRAWAAATVDQVCERGDILQFSGGKKGQTAEAFNALARGLAAGAYVPGGITFAGLHWCVEPHPPIPCPNRPEESAA
jgi:hypothetical protein